VDLKLLLLLLQANETAIEINKMKNLYLLSFPSPFFLLVGLFFHIAAAGWLAGFESDDKISLTTFYVMHTAKNFKEEDKCLLFLVASVNSNRKPNRNRFLASAECVCVCACNLHGRQAEVSANFILFLPSFLALFVACFCFCLSSFHDLSELALDHQQKCPFFSFSSCSVPLEEILLATEC